MKRSTRDPLDGLSRSEKKAWRALERRARREHDTEQLAALIGLAAAGGGITGLATIPDDDPRRSPAAPCEMIIEGRRLRAGRVSRLALAKLRDAVTNIAAVPLTAVGRYGPYWVLTFRVATEQLVVLVEHLTLVPDWNGPGGRDLAPAGPPLASLGI